jgi:DNA-binding response OmpR family regulator
MTHDTYNSPPGEMQNPTILIVEDDLFLLKAYGIKFKQEGWHTVLLSEGAAAMTYLAEAPPDVVILDLALPGTSGFEIFEAIRKDARWKDIPVFVLTNSDQGEDLARAKKLGAAEYIVKVNTGINDIVEKIKIYIHEHRKKSTEA